MHNNHPFRPARTLVYLSIAQERALGCEYPIGDPWGGAAFGEKNKGGVFSSGYWSNGGIINSVVSLVKDPVQYTKERLAEFDKTVIQPVGHGLEKVGQAIASDPENFALMLAAAATQQWYIVAAMAMVISAGKGNDWDKVLTDGAIAGATSFVAVEGSGMLMESMKVTAQGATSYAVAGIEISKSTATVIANTASYTATSAVSAAATGKSVGEAALKGAITGGLISGIQSADILKDFSAAIDSVAAKGVGSAITNAISGAAGTMLSGIVTGKDMSTQAGMALVGGAVSGLTAAVKISGDFFSNNAAEALDLQYDDYGPRNDTRSVAEYLTDKLGPVGAGFVTNTVTSILTSTFTKGAPSDFLAQQIMGNLTQSIKNAFDPNFKARYVDPLAGFMDEAKAAATDYNEAANAQNALVERVNGNVTAYNNRVAALDPLYAERDRLAAQYDGMTSANSTQAQADALRAQIVALDNRISGEVSSLKSFYQTDVVNLQAQYESLKARTDEAQKNYVSISEVLGEKAAPLTQYLNDTTKQMAIETAKTLDPNFNPEEYRTLNGLSSTDDVGAHYISVGKDQGLYTSFEAAQGQLEDLQFKAMDKFARSMGYSGGAISLPQSIYNDALDKIQGTLGNNLKAWESFTPDSYLQQAKLPPTAIMPMWDSQSKELTVAKVIYNDGQEQLVNITTKLPEGRAAATATQILNGQADMVRGNDGNFYWTVGNDQSSAMIYDASTKQMVKAVMSPALDAAPAGATNISYNEDGSVAGYTGSDGVYRTTITGVAQDNPNDADVIVTAKRVGTALDEADPLVQMYTYANVPDGIAANFNIKGVVQAANDVVNYMQKDASDINKLKIATIVKSAGSVMQDVGTVLGDLSVTIGLSKTNNSTLASLGEQLEGLANAKTPAQYKEAMDDIEAMRKAAKGTDIVGVNAAIAQKYPDLVGISVFGGELFEEVIQNGVGKAAMVAGGALAATLGAPALIAGAIGAGVGYGVSMAMDFSESYRGAKEEMYSRMYDIYKGKGYSDAQAGQMADAAATKAGVMNGLITMVVNGATPGDLNKVLFGGKASPAQEAITNYFVDKLQTAGKVALSEFGEGLVEGTLQGMYNETLVYSVDPSKADYKKGMADSAMLESIIGAPVAAGTYAIDNSLAMATATYTMANKAFTDQLTSSGEYTTGELGAVLNNWGVNTDVRNIAVPYAVEKNPEILTYATSLEMTQAPISAADSRSPVDATLDYIKNGYQLTGSLKAIAAEAKDQPDLKSAVEQMYYGIVGRPAEEAGLNGWMDYVKKNNVNFDQLAQAMANSPEAKVDTLYRSLLGRTPDAEGAAFYINQLLKGDTLEHVAQNIGSSHEAHVYQATQLYQQLLGREPDQPGLDFWVSRLDSGMPLNTVRNAFFESAEGDSYANNVKLVTNLYKTILGREPDAGGLDGWAKSLTDDFWTYDQVVDHFKNSPEANSHDGHVNQVKYLYRSILGREAEPEGLANAVALLDSGVTMDQLRPMFVNSPENAEYLRVQAAEKTLSDLGVTDPTVRLDFLNAQFDPRYTTQKEAIDQLAARGLTDVTAADAAQFVGKTATYQADDMNAYVNKNMVSALELQAAANEQNYAITQQDLDRLVGRGVQADVIAKFVQEIDPKATTNSEATQYFVNLGYDRATASEIAQFVRSAPEAEMEAAIAAYVDPRQVTRQEAADFFASFNGYVPTDAEINKYVVQGPDVFQNAIRDQIGEYVDPRYVDASEVEAAFKTLGLQAPLTLADVARLSGQYSESELAARAKEYLPVATANAVYAAATGKPTVTLADIQAAINNIQFPAGLSKEDVTVAIADYLTKNPGLTLDQVAAKIGEATAGLATTEGVNTALANALKDVSTKKDITDVKSALETAIQDAKNSGLQGDAALQAAINSVAGDLGTTRADLLNQIGATEVSLKTEFASQLSEAKQYTQAQVQQAAAMLQDQITKNQNAGMDAIAATNKAISDLSDYLGVSTDTIRTEISAVNSDLASKIQQASQESQQYTQQQVSQATALLQAQITANQNAGMDAIAATNKAVHDVAAQLGTTTSNLQAQISTSNTQLAQQIADAQAASQAYTQQQVQQSQTAIMEKMAQYEAAGMSRDAALNKAISDVSAQLGTTANNLLAQMGMNQQQLQAQIEAASLAGQQYTQQQVQQSQQTIMDKMAQYEAAGMSRDAALNAAINDVSAQLGTTANNLLAQMGTNQQQLLAQIGQTQTQLQADIAKAKSDIQTQMAAYEQAGIDRDTALSLAISGVSQQLGTTKTDLLTKIGTTEANLKTEFTAQISGVSQQVQDVAKLLGKPANQVTAADLQMVQNMVGGTAATNLAYDTNNDGKIDQTDITNIQNNLAFQQNQNIQQQVDPNTGLTIYVDTTTGKQVEKPTVGGTQWASTGIYSVLDQQKAQQAATAKAQATSAKAAQQKQNFNQMMNMVLGAPDATGRKVEVKTPDPARINYMYDWSSIFANPQQANLMPSPYGAVNTYGQPTQQGGLGSLQTPQAANQSQYKMAVGGYAEGGMINNDISVGDGGSIDDLLNILKGNG